MPDRLSALVKSLVTTLLTTEASLAPAVRTAVFERAAAAGSETGDETAVPDDVRTYVDKVARHAYRVTDDDVAILKAAGYTEDQLFEVTLCAATGAAWTRLERGLNALRGGT